MGEGADSSRQLCNEGQTCEMPPSAFSLHQEFLPIFVTSLTLPPEQVVLYWFKCEKLNPEHD